MKRFYTLVSTEKQPEGYAILLDGKPVKTPLKKELLAPNENIANAIQMEWADQEDDITPDTMPLTQILSTRIDRVGQERQTIEATLLKYLDTDLLCYRAEQPPELLKAQEESWNPHLKWFEEKFGCPLKTTNNLAALTQDKKAHDAVSAHVSALDDDYFTILQLVSALVGSVVLGLHALERQLDADALFAAARVEEGFKAKIYNEDFYGQDPAQEKKDNVTRAELNAALDYLSHLSS